MLVMSLGRGPVHRVSLSVCGRWLGVVRDGPPGRGRREVYDRVANSPVYGSERYLAEQLAVHPSGATFLIWASGKIDEYGLRAAPIAAVAQEPILMNTRSVYELQMSSDGQHLAGLLSGVAGGLSNGGAVVGMTASDGYPRPLWSTPLLENHDHFQLAVSPTGNLVGLASVPAFFHQPRNPLEVFDLAGGNLVLTGEVPSQTLLTGILPDGAVILWEYDRLGVYDLAAERWRGPRLTTDDEDDTIRVAISPCGHLILAGWLGCVHLLEADTLSIRQSYTLPTAGKPTCVAFAPDGLTAACGTSKGEVVIWDVD